METEPYQKALRKRKVWIEPLFAEGKLWHGMRRFRTRTLDKVNAEALMTATGQNIKRLLAFGHRGPRKSAPAVALRPPDRLLPDLAHRAFRDHRRKRRIVLRFSTRWIVFGTTINADYPLTCRVPVLCWHGICGLGPLEPCVLNHRKYA
jgi:hypothetical protein